MATNSIPQVQTCSMQQRVRERRPERGAAFAEAIIMLPVFTIVFFGVMYVKDITLAAHDALAQARSCAWAYSKAGCDRDHLPAGCTLKNNQLVGNTPDTLFRRDPNAAAEPVESPDSFADAHQSMEEGMAALPKDKTKKQSDLVDKLKDVVVDVVMSVAKTFGNEKGNLYGAKSVTPPLALGPKRTAGVGYRLACNTVHQDLGDVFGKLFEPINPF